jgi:hypothetical protein
MNVGKPTRSLALADVRRRDYLPVDDKAWEQREQSFLGPLGILRLRLGRRESLVNLCSFRRLRTSLQRPSPGSAKLLICLAMFRFTSMTVAVPRMSDLKKLGNSILRYWLSVRFCSRKFQAKQQKYVSRWVSAIGTSQCLL